MRRDVNGAIVELLRGDITDQPDIDAIVNAANAQLQIGGGVAGAIHRAAGPGLAQECAPLAPIRPGECVLTGGHDLVNPHVLHCLGPVYGVDEPPDRLLGDGYRNALRIADESGLSSIAFPAISTGAFGYPLEPAAKIALATIIGELDGRSTVRLVRMVLFGQRDLDVHTAILERLTSSR